MTFNETRTNSFVIEGKDVWTNIGIGTSESWELTNTNQTGTWTVMEDVEVGATAPTTIKAGATIYFDEDGSAYYAQAEDEKYYALTGFDGDWANVTGAATTNTAKDDDWVEATGTLQSYSGALDKALTDIAEATDWLRSYANELGNNYAIIQTRQDFTEAMIDVLETGSDNLVLADMNEESANYLALQTRQQLAINSLSLASQSAQSVLSLF